MSKIPFSDLNKRDLFLLILPYVQSAIILVSQGLISEYSVIYILHLEMNLRKFVFKMIGFFIKLLIKVLLK